MAKLKGYDGTITIDDFAANRDISDLKDCAVLLKEARDILNFKSAGVDNDRFAGNASSAFADVMKKIDTDLNNSEYETNHLKGLIEGIVKHYQEIDKKVNQAVQGAFK